MRPNILFAGALAAMAHAAFAQAPIEYKTPASFVGSLKNGSIAMSDKGDLTGDGRDDWAGEVIAENAEGYKDRAIYIFRRTANDSYLVAAKSAPRSAEGGTGNYFYEGLDIRNGSLFVSMSYHWKTCGGNARSQFKLHKNQWRMIGLKSVEMNQSDTGSLNVASDANLLTGAAILTRTIDGKATTEKMKIKQEIILFENYEGSGAFSIVEKEPVC